MSLEEVVYWIAVVAATSNAQSMGVVSNRAWWVCDLAIRRKSEQLQAEAYACLRFAGIVGASSQAARRGLTLRALCREAVRAIEREQSGPK